MKSIQNVLIIKTEWQEGEMKKMQRMTYLDCAKGVAIILVVLGHIDMGNNPLNNWIYSFHMPLFFVLSGMLMAYKNNCLSTGLWVNVKKRSVQLLYPYFTFSLITLIWLVVDQLKRGHADANFIIQVIIDTLSLDGYGAIWFLPALLMAEIFFLMIFRGHKGSILLVGCLVLLTSVSGMYLQVAIPLERDLLTTYLERFYNMFNRSLIGTVFIWFGYSLFGKLEKAATGANKPGLIILGIVMFVANFFLAQSNPSVDLHYSVLNNPVLYYVCALLGTVSTLLFFKFILPNNRVLEYFGRNSMIIMGTQSIVPLTEISKNILGMTGMSFERYSYDVMICILSMIMNVVMIELINRFFPYILRRVPFREFTANAG